MEFNYKLICILLLLVFIISYNAYYIINRDIKVYNMLVHNWGAQLVIDNVHTFLNSGDVIDNKFKWFPKYNSYTGIYHIDTGSHLLTDMISTISRDEIKTLLNNNNINNEDLGKIQNYAYVQGGTTPLIVYNNISIDNHYIHNFPVGLMSIYNQENMIQERSSVNGIIGLASINPSNNLHKYSSVNPLLENGSRRTILLDFINKKFIIGDNPPPIYTFKGKMDYDNNIMRMDVWIEHKGKEHKLLIDTGTLYSQFLETGPIELSGIDDKDSHGKIVMKNAKILRNNYKQ